MSSQSQPPAGQSAPSEPQVLALDANGRIVWRRLIAFLAMVLGMFMAILDIQIVSASLAEIQAGLSASAEEITWVQTSYLIAEVIMIPLSGFLSRALGTRLLFTVAAAGFTVASLMCAFATSITEMIIWRTIQGFIGGGMIPTVMATAYMLFPREKQAYVNPLLGLIITLAPTVGPTIGGIVTGAFSWHWLFLINVLPGILITMIVFNYVDFDKPDWALLKRCDWIGVTALVAFLGPLEYVLEEGARANWFEDESILICTAISVFAGGVFFYRALTSSEPILNLRPLRNRNFAVGTTLGFTVGVGLFGLTYLFPLYLGQIRGYSALMIGQAVFVTGLTMFVSAPILGRLMQKIDPRAILAAGLLAFALGTWKLTGLTSDWDFWELLVPQMLRGFGMMAAMVPINMLCFGALPRDQLKNAAGLYNVIRNLGGALGLALLSTLLGARTDLHLMRLHEKMSLAHQPGVEVVQQLTRRLQEFGTDAPHMALRMLNSIVHKQGVVMAFADVFYVLTALFLLLTPATLLLRRPTDPATAGSASEAH